MACAVCTRDASRMNNDQAECSHVDCPHRRPLTAACPAQENTSAAWLPMGMDSGGCYRANPTSKE